MSSGKKTAPTVSVLAEHVSDHLSVFVVAEDTDAKRPANGGLRVLNYPSDEACIADGQRLAGLMTHKHDLYGTVSPAARSLPGPLNPMPSRMS